MTVTEGAGPGPAPHPYVHVRDIDDGTWWHMIQPGSHGYGIVPWISNPLDNDKLQYLSQTNVSCGLADQTQLLFTPAFVEWQSANSGLSITISEWWCYDKLQNAQGIDQDEPDALRPRSHIVNAEVGFEDYHNVSLTVPVWSVTPVDRGFFLSWLDEAHLHWEGLAAQRHYENLYRYTCTCGEPYQDHAKACPCRPGIDSCSGWIFMHMCDWGEPDEPINPDYCNSGCGEDFDADLCDCGFYEAHENFAKTVDYIDCRASILTEPELLQDTWAYAVESYYRGWERCWQIHKAVSDDYRSLSYKEITQRKDLYWYYSLWLQLSPFWQSPGPVQLELMRSPRSTASATLLAS